VIWESLNEDLIVTSMDAKTTDDVFARLGGLLVQQGYAKESYVAALAEREAEFPTGLNLGEYGIAIPHTAVEHVNKGATAIATLKEPVRFVEMATDDDPVDARVIFMLAVVDPKDHIEELQRILKIVTDQEVIKALLSAQESQEVIDIIKKKEISL